MNISKFSPQYKSKTNKIMISNFFQKPTKKVFTFCFVLSIMLNLLDFNAYAQSASSTWSLTANTSGSVSGNVTATSATITAATAVGFITCNSNTGYCANNWDNTLTALNKYYEVSISPASGYILTVTSVSYSYNAGTFSGCSTHANEIRSRYSTNNFTTPVNLQALSMGAGATWESYSSGVLAVVVNDGSTFKLRIYFSTNNGSDAAIRNYVRNLVISGTTVGNCTNPTVNTHPSNQTVCPSSNANFSVSATGTSLTYQWQASADGSTGWANVANGTPSGVTYTNATTSTLTANGTSPLSTYYYRCVVSSGVCSVNSNSATLTINAPPSISANPTSTTIFSSGNANMSVTASGAGLTYQWQYNSGTWGSVSNGTPTGATYTNATTNNVTISGITATGNHQYRCVVSGTCTPSATSGTGTLTVDLSSSDAWGTKGNTGTDNSINFLGTTDNKDVVVKTNGAERARVKGDGTTSFNTLSGTGNGIVTTNSTGTITRTTFSGNANDVLLGDGTFGTAPASNSLWHTSGNVAYTDSGKQIGIGYNPTGTGAALIVNGNTIVNGKVRAREFDIIDIMETDSNHITVQNDLIIEGAGGAGGKNNISTQNAPLRIQDGSGAQHTIFNSGNTGKVGIGVEIPTEKLHILGNVKVEGQLLADSITIPKIFTSRLTSPDSLIRLGDHTIYINTVRNTINWATTPFSDALNGPHFIGFGMGNAFNINQITWINSYLGPKGTGKNAIAIGSGNSEAAGLNSMTLGAFVKSSGENSITLGSGIITDVNSNSTSTNIPLQNSTPYSFAVGFKSNKPTLKVTAGDNTANSYGNVGIATDNPNSAYKLDVNGYINSTGYYLNNNPLNFSGIWSSGTAAHANDIFNSNTGNVGIGTSVPDAKLVVSDGTDAIKFYGNSFGDISVTGKLRPHFAGSDFTVYNGTPGNSNLRLQVTNSGDYSFYSGGTAGSGGETLRFNINNSTGNTLLAPNGGTTNIGLTTPGTAKLNIYDSGTSTPLLLVSNGNTTYNNGELFKITADGVTHAREIIVEVSAFPDYVFKPEYKLASINEVNEYILKNGHLKGFPSAAEVAKGGLNVGGNQLKLVEKIEEQTLYIIELNKYTLELNKRLVELEKEIQSLKNK